METSVITTPETAIAVQPADAVDLHLHTLASDGAWTPAALVDQLVAEGIRVAAVCDHDTQRSVLETMRRAERRGIHIIPGVEITTNWRDRQWHLLVYGIRPDRADEAAAPFRAVLAELDARLAWLGEDARQRFERSGRKLASLEEIVGGRPLWPYHVLRAAIREGHAANLKTAAELTRQLGGDFNADLPLARVVEAAHQAGGLCVVAHPGRGDTVGVMTEADLEAMLAAGIAIDGLEGHYRSYTDQQTAEYREMAVRHGLLISCGSDSHAAKQPVDPKPWRAIWCADLLRRLGLEVAPLPDGEPVWEAGMPLATKPEPPPDAGSEAGVATNGAEPAATERHTYY
ncbi:MAG: PHP domain-containing protein [Chloroflexota bacterium]|nr:PHP domain-containing protein [Chloroflexota bacterium]